ncbi:hypothetical protein BT69DRAFT_1289551 [Atractiella rhizophila]|nr:hypothetical protein BT69DRAFT_1289551 [Atractiella rhizophila]
MARENGMFGGGRIENGSKRVSNDGFSPTTSNANINTQQAKPMPSLFSDYGFYAPPASALSILPKPPSFQPATTPKAQMAVPFPSSLDSDSSSSSYAIVNPNSKSYGHHRKRGRGNSNVSSSTSDLDDLRELSRKTPSGRGVGTTSTAKEFKDSGTIRSASRGRASKGAGERKYDYEYYDDDGGDEYEGLKKTPVARYRTDFATDETKPSSTAYANHPRSRSESSASEISSVPFDLQPAGSFSLPGSGNGSKNNSRRESIINDFGIDSPVMNYLNSVEPTSIAMAMSTSQQQMHSNSSSARSSQIGPSRGLEKVPGKGVAGGMQDRFYKDDNPTVSKATYTPSVSYFEHAPTIQAFADVSGGGGKRVPSPALEGYQFDDEATKAFADRLNGTGGGESMKARADLEDDGGAGAVGVKSPLFEQLRTKEFKSLGEDFSDEEIRAQVTQGQSAPNKVSQDLLMDPIPRLQQDQRRPSPNVQSPADFLLDASPLVSSQRPSPSRPSMDTQPQRPSPPSRSSLDIQHGADPRPMFNPSPRTDLSKTPRYDYEPEPLISKARILSTGPASLFGGSEAKVPMKQTSLDPGIARVERVIRLVEMERAAKAKAEAAEKARKEEATRREKMAEAQRKEKEARDVLLRSGPVIPTARERKTSVDSGLARTAPPASMAGAYWGIKDGFGGIMDRAIDSNQPQIGPQFAPSPKTDTLTPAVSTKLEDAKKPSPRPDVPLPVPPSAPKVDQGRLGEWSLIGGDKDIRSEDMERAQERLRKLTNKPIPQPASKLNGSPFNGSPDTKKAASPRGPAIDPGMSAALKTPLFPTIDRTVRPAANRPETIKPAVGGWGELRSRVTPSAETAFNHPIRNHRRSMSGSYVLQPHQTPRQYPNLQELNFSNIAITADAMLEARLNEATLRATEANLRAKIKAAEVELQTLRGKGEGPAKATDVRPRRASMSSPMVADGLNHLSPSLLSEPAPAIPAKPLKSILKKNGSSKDKTAAKDASTSAGSGGAEGKGDARTSLFSTEGLRRDGKAAVRGAGGLALPALKAAAEVQRANSPAIPKRTRRVSFDLPDLAPSHRTTPVSIGHNQAGLLVGGHAFDNGGIVPALGMIGPLPPPFRRVGTPGLAPLNTPRMAPLAAPPKLTTNVAPPNVPPARKRITMEMLEAMGKVREGQLLKEIELEKRKLALELETIHTEGRQQDREDIVRRLNAELRREMAENDRRFNSPHVSNIDPEELLQRKLEELQLRKLALISEISAGFNDSAAQAKLKGKGVDLSGTFLFSPSESSSDVFEFNEHSEVTSQALGLEADKLITEIKDGLHSLEDIKARKAVIELKLRGLKK